jgi:integrase
VRRIAIARLVMRLRETGHTGDILANTIREGGAADAAEMRKLERLVERIVSGKEPGLARRHGARREGTTVAELAKLWTSGDLARQYPDHVKAKKTSDDDKRILEWLSKVRMPDGATFGERQVAAVTLDDCDHVMTALPKTAEAPGTRRQYAQALRKLLVYAVYPLRLLPTLPIPKGWLPKPGAPKAKAWIYPAEDLALMRCRDVRLARRLFFGLLVREGMRESEALNLTWRDLDLEHGVVRLDENKTDDPRSWALGADVARALLAWKRVRGKKAEKIPRVFPKVLMGTKTSLVVRLRRGLECAGVKRPELVQQGKGRMRLRVHDLRGTFVTLALACGQTEAWVTDRTGHRSSAMVYRYKRAARTAAELGLGWLAPLDEAIPELAEANGSQRANRVQTGRPSGPHTTRGRSKTPRRGHVGTRRTPVPHLANPLHVGSNPIRTSEGTRPGAARLLLRTGGHHEHRPVSRRQARD